MIKKKKESASFGVIGLGRFGTALAITLAQACLLYTSDAADD